MRVEVVMVLELSVDSAEDWEIESHIQDALASYEGNDIEFRDCNIRSCEKIF